MSFLKMYWRYEVQSVSPFGLQLALESGDVRMRQGNYLSRT
jgi:hypothetical protein